MKKLFDRTTNILGVVMGILFAQASWGAISNFVVSNDATNAVYRFTYTGTRAYLRLFLDTDKNSLTGARRLNMGADFLVENANFYRYSGVNGAWGWTRVKAAVMTKTVSTSGTTVQWIVPRADLGSPAGLSVVGQVESPLESTALINQLFSNSTTTTTLPPASTWVRCATEGGTCAFTGTRQVRYGANGIYAYRTATSSIGCNNSVFGDPVVGVTKFCDFSNALSTTTTLAPPPTTLPPPPTTTMPRVSGVPAFIGASGGGSKTVGGRGGRVIEVTSLADSGPGTLREALLASGPRIVVFRVGGTIWLRSGIRITSPYLTVAGQTAPGGGILIAGRDNPENMIYVYTHDVVLRYLKIRSGANANRPPGSQKGAPLVVGLAASAYNVVSDHLSLSWTSDENYTIWANTGVIRDVTMSHSIIGEALGGHSTGIITGGIMSVANETNNIDFHHNMLISHSHRLPLLKNKSSRFINNIVYNYGYYASQALGGISADFIGNYYKRGPLNPGSIHELQFSERDSQDGPTGTPSIYLSGNVGPYNSNPSGDNWTMAARVTGENGGETGAAPLSFRRSAPLPPSAIPIPVDAVSSLDTTMVPTVGASRRLDENGNWVMNRDSVDTRMINDYKNGTGTIPTTERDVGGFPVISSGIPYTDTDRDGMPDAWEKAQGLNPNNASDGQAVRSDGLTNLEHFLK